MRTLLRIDASARLQGSHSRSLANHFQSVWARIHPGGTVIQRDLAQAPPPHLNQTTIAAFGAETETSDATALSDELIAELKSADDVLISSPLYNFGFPSTLKAYFDHVVRSGHTFTFDESGAIGLLEDKSAYVVTSRGGTTSPDRADDFQTAHLRAILGYVGILDVETVSLEGTAGSQEDVSRHTTRARQEIDRVLATCEPRWIGSFTPQDRRQIEALRSAQAEAISQGDAERYSRLCVDDIHLMLPGHDIISGREQFLAVERKLLGESNFNSFRKCPEQIEVRGELAVEIGRQRVVAAPGSPDRSDVFLPDQKYTHIFRRTPEGWRFSMLMSNICA